MNSEFPFRGRIVGNDARVHKNYNRLVRLRQTKTMWIAQDGLRFSKKRLTQVGQDWPMYRLEKEPKEFRL